MHFFKSELMIIISLVVFLTPDGSNSTHEECMADVNLAEMDTSKNGFQMYLYFVFDTFHKIQGSVKNINFDSKIKMLRHNCVNDPSIFEILNKNIHMTDYASRASPAVFTGFKKQKKAMVCEKKRKETPKKAQRKKKILSNNNDENLDSMSITVIQYMCDIVIFSVYETNIHNAKKWCEKYAVESPFFSNTDDKEQKKKDCTDYLKEYEFNYNNGIDNYASLLRQSGKDKLAEKTYLDRNWDIRIPNTNTIDELTSDDNDLSDRVKTHGAEIVALQYSLYLKNQGPSELHKIRSMKDWCLDYDCEIELNIAGFTNRYKGSVNYYEIVVRHYDLKCEDLTSNTVKEYCKYLKDIFKNEKEKEAEATSVEKKKEKEYLVVNSKSIDKALGNRGWCKKVREEGIHNNVKN